MLSLPGAHALVSGITKKRVIVCAPTVAEPSAMATKRARNLTARLMYGANLRAESIMGRLPSAGSKDSPNEGLGGGFVELTKHLAGLVVLAIWAQASIAQDQALERARRFA